MGLVASSEFPKYTLQGLCIISIILVLFGRRMTILQKVSMLIYLSFCLWLHWELESSRETGAIVKERVEVIVWIRWKIVICSLNHLLIAALNFLTLVLVWDPNVIGTIAEWRLFYV